MSEPKEAAPSLSSADSRSQEKSGAPPTAGPNATLDPSTPSSSVTGRSTTEPKSIGPYRLLNKLGEGGMGLVWLAEQTAPVQRLVAVKLIRSGFYDDSVLQRFKSEQQSLAVMNHPTIAKVFDAGTTPDGQPYFVMEYVEGASVTRYCDIKKLKIRDRLELFIKVCEGVQHAHQKAIIHRDLKPSNVLVAEIDGKPVPRIIDFGIAKAIASQSAPDQTLFTQAGAFVGTRGFVSPEQAAGAEDVDTRTDVYSLGVILYVLLTGTLPFDTEQSKKRPMDEVLRQLREDDPPTPSSKLNLDKQTTQSAAEQRSVAPGELTRLLRGDLDWITMRAVERQRSRRYGSPSELAADIQRYLDNEPVLARPASVGYRLGKYVRRHRIGVAVSAAAVLLLIAFAVTQAMQLRRITRERDRANRITDFMTSMFKVSDPSESRGNSITAREVLDKASNDVGANLAKDPELKAQLMHVMGIVYMNLGLYARAEPLLKSAADTRIQILGQKNVDTLASIDRLAWVLQYRDRYREAEAMLRDVVSGRRRLLGPENNDTLESMDELAWVLGKENRFAEAEQLQREVLVIRRRTLGSQNLSSASAMMHLASSLLYEGHLSEAEALGREAIDVRRSLLGRDSLVGAGAMMTLGVILDNEGKYAEEEKMEREVTDIEARVLGPEHPETLLAKGNLAWCLVKEGRFGEAEKIQRDVVETERRVLGPEHSRTLRTTGELAVTLKYEGQNAKAEKLQRDILEIQSRVDGPESVDTLATENNLANTLLDENRYAEAEKLQREALEVRRRVSGPENNETLLLADNLATTLRLEGKLDEAEQLFRADLEIAQRTLRADHPRISFALFNLACLAADRKQNEQAFSLLREAVDHGLGANVVAGMEQERDLKPLHGDPRFSGLVAEAKQHLHASQNPNQQAH